MTAPGCKHLWAYEAQVQTNTSKIIPICFKVNLVSADNDDPTIHPLQSSISASKGEGLTHNLPTQEQSQSESLARNGHQQTMNITRSQETREQDTNPSALMLKMHYKLGHLPFSKIRFMAANGTLDGRMANCRIPTCAACSYGKATKKPWRNKTPNHKIGSQQTMMPGICVSVDQMESPIPGLVAHMKGTPTKC